MAGNLCILGGISLPIYLVSFRWDHLLPPPWWTPGWYQVEVGLLFLLYCGASRLVWYRNDAAKTALLTIFTFALLFRLPLLFTEPRTSTDLYRYIWDGRVQTAGMNPYRYAPEDEALRPLRDDPVYRWINRKEFPTVYPAAAQLVFWGAATVGLTTPARLKAFLLLFDLGSSLLLLQLLDHAGVNRLRVLLFMWNPLIIYESAHTGHLETLVVFCVLGALLAFVKQRANLAFISLAVATGLKFYPALLTAVLARGRAMRCAAIFAAVLLCAYAPYLSVGGKLIGFLPRYFSDPDEITNLGLPSLLFFVFSPAMAGWILRLTVLTIAGWVFFSPEVVSSERRTQKKIAVDSRAILTVLYPVYLLISVHTLLLYPALYPWYLSWLIPLLCFFPSPGWLYFSCVSAFVYITWPTPSWVLWLEYAPLYLLLFLEITGGNFLSFEKTKTNS